MFNPEEIRLTQMSGEEPESAQLLPSQENRKKTGKQVKTMLKYEPPTKEIVRVWIIAKFGHPLVWKISPEHD